MSAYDRAEIVRLLHLVAATGYTGPGHSFEQLLKAYDRHASLRDGGTAGGET